MIVIIVFIVCFFYILMIYMCHRYIKNGYLFCDKNKLTENDYNLVEDNVEV